MTGSEDRPREDARFRLRKGRINQMKNLVFVVVTLASAGVALAANPYGLYSRDGKIVMEESSGFWHVTNVGKQDWALTAADAHFDVKPGDLFKMTCTARTIAKAGGRGVGMGVVLLDRNGKVLEWGYARTALSAGRTTEKTFAVPRGGAKIYARVSGDGDADFEISPLKLERVGAVTCAAGLPETFALATDALRLEVRSDSLALAVTDRRTGRTWETRTAEGGFPKYFVRTFEADERQVRFGVTDAVTLGQLAVAYRLDPKEPSEFTVTVAGRGACAEAFAYPDPFAARKGDWMVLPLSEGYRLPMHEETFAVWQPKMWSSSMSMAFFGVEEEGTGAGWMAIAETRNDAKVNVVNAGRKPVALGPLWAPERGQFGYPRVVRYRFLDRGGYVAMAERYRRTAEEQGLVKTFREKAKERPNVDRLLGAPNVWYYPSGRDPQPADVARELKAAGIGRFLWSENCSETNVAQIAALPDVLVGRYDCYRDIYTPELMEQLGWKAGESEICRNTSAWPDDVIWDRADDSNSVRQAWGVTCRDGKKRFCAAQCTCCQAKRERANVTWELKRKPFTSRFIDVTTAVGAEECENPAHPMTRTRSRAAICEVLGLLGDEFKLVVGSEQGIDFAVPVCDYFEGMMSPGHCRMPHGRPGAQRHDIFREGMNPTNVTPAEIARVVTYHLGEKYRIPLFELVFHDCCCAHWYWYDYSNRPLCWWKKRDLFNVLYGTAPMYIFDYRLWKERKEMFVRSYNEVCPVARRTGYSRMTDHRSLTPDCTVQRSTFADGTVVTVNFGDKPYRMEDGTQLNPMDSQVRVRR